MHTFVAAEIGLKFSVLKGNCFIYFFPEVILTVKFTLYAGIEVVPKQIHA